MSDDSWIQPPLSFLYKEKKMSMNFTQGTPLADLERQMRMVPNFAPRGHGRRVLCSYHPTAADVDCRYCLQHRNRACQSQTCPYLSERLEAGAVTLAELAAETIQAWWYVPLKQRALSVMRRTDAFRFEGRLHVLRMMDVMDKSQDFADSKWVAAVYLLSAHTELWMQTSKAVWRNQVDFASVKSMNIGIQDYVLYRAAKGIFHGTLGATSEELSDSSLVNNDTLLLVLSAALIARYGPDVMKIGRVER